MPAQLRFSDVDRFGHVNNNVYFSLFDMSKSQYLFDVVGKDIYEHLAIVVAHIESNFITPVYYPEEIYIRTSITRMGNKGRLYLAEPPLFQNSPLDCFEIHPLAERLRFISPLFKAMSGDQGRRLWTLQAFEKA